MSPDPADTAKGRTDAARGTLAIAGAVLAAIALSLAFGALTRTAVMPDWLQIAGAYLAVWIPLGVVVALAWRGRPGRGILATTRPRLRLTAIDVLFGIGIGLLARGIAAIVQVALTGVMPGGGIRLELDPVAWWFGLIVAPVLLAPVIEELFFRGVAQPVVTDAARAAGSAPRTATLIGIVATAAVFALLHTLDAATPTGAWVVALSTFVFGCAVGTLVAVTGRLGGAIVAHAVFNLTLVLLLV